MSLGPLPQTNVIGTKGERWSAVWQSWVNGVQQWLGPQGGFGVTAARPTTGLYVGLAFYDTTLGYPVFVHRVTPSVIWHNAAGAPV
jgi:hypothetical protein